MGIKVDKKTLDKALAKIDRVPKIVNFVVEDVFAEVGAYITDGIRNGSLSSWQDDSGNLRSSVGYAVARKGRITKMSDFETVLNGAEGSAKGKRKVAEIASKYAQYDCMLVIVAGEEYAVYVEAVNGKVVMSEGYNYIEKNLPKQLKYRVRNALKSL